MLSFLENFHPARQQVTVTAVPPVAPIAGQGPDAPLNARFLASTKATLLVGAQSEALQPGARGRRASADVPSPQRFVTRPTLAILVGDGAAVDTPPPGYQWRPAASPVSLNDGSGQKAILL